MLHVHRSERADGLVRALRQLLADPLPDPFQGEVVCVPTHGMERWLTQQMSTCLGASEGRSDGICANIDFPSPRRLIGDAIAAATGIEPDKDPWLPERAAWPLLEVVENALGEPWLSSLTAYLGGTTDPDPVRRSRRLSTVRHLAALFDRYGLYRPDMVRAWADGEDVDGAGGALGGAAWQAELWRRLRARIAEPSPAERLAAACDRLRAGVDAFDAPERLALFGLTRLPAGHMHVLRAIAATRDVHLFLLHPSAGLWSRMRDQPPVVRRAQDPTVHVPENRLLASWGRDAREMQLVLGSDLSDTHHAVDHRSETLLARLQADVRDNQAPPGAPLPGQDDPRPKLDPGDRSLQVHACHGRPRQVEVLRDVILHALREDPTLEPRDVIVMCPDIETFAPLIKATFGAGELTDDEIEPLPADIRPVDLRVRLADRALRQTNPVLGAVAQVIALADQRLTASQLLDFADREAVRRRFGFDDDDLARMQDWIADSGIRWGLDAAHRAPFQLSGVEAGTWRFGLDRILLGVAMNEDDRRLFSRVLPLDDVESGAIELVGRFAELVDRVAAAVDAFSTPKPIDAWAAAIATAADALTSTRPRDAWQRVELQRLLDDAVGQATVEDAVNGADISLAEIRTLLAERLQGRPTRANFRTGHLTICTLVPMRSVPHRVVCLMGLDDGVFPRKAPRDGDDLMLDDPHIGERDPRSEDRQQLLDALLAARDRLIITYTGNDERTNTKRPPAVPVGELLDVVDATVRVEDGRARDRVETRHPLQPFDPRNFRRDRAWSFDQVTLGGARALTGPRTDPPPFLESPLPLPEGTVVEVESLVRFVQHPARAFLRQRLEVSVGDYSDEIADDLPIELDGLEKWAVGQRILDAMLAGVDGRTATLAEIARGSLPPGVLGQPIVNEVFPVAEAIFKAAQTLVPADAPSGSLDVRVLLPGGRVLSGTVPGVTGDMVRTVTYSRVAAKHRLAAWVRLLALTAAHPERPFESVTVGKGRDSVLVARIERLGADDAMAHLEALVDLYDRGMREPLPLFCAASAAYAGASADSADAVKAAADAWTTTGFGYDKEDVEPEHLLVHDGSLSLDELLATPPRSDETWVPDEPSRFGVYARRLWDPLLAAEELTLL